MAPGPMGLALLVCLVQATQPQPAPPQAELPVSVERIQRELVKPSPPPLETERAIATFRVTIEARTLKFPALWDPSDPMVPSYIRPRMPLYHYEFLMAVTPQEFRAGVLHPITVDVIPGIEKLADAIRKALRRREEERARKEVDEALRQLLEARKKAGKP